MEEITENLTQDDVLDLITNFPLNPLRNKLVISVNLEENEFGDDIFSEVQYVLAKGPHVYESIQPGCRVLLDMQKMSDNQGVVNIKPVKVGDRVFCLTSDAFVEAVDLRD